MTKCYRVGLVYRHEINVYVHAINADEACELAYEKAMDNLLLLDGIDVDKYRVIEIEIDAEECTEDHMHDWEDDGENDIL